MSNDFLKWYTDMLFPGKAALLSPQIMLTIFSFKGFIGKAFPFPINHSIFLCYKNNFQMAHKWNSIIPVCSIDFLCSFKFFLAFDDKLFHFFLVSSLSRGCWLGNCWLIVATISSQCCCLILFVTVLDCAPNIISLWEK